MALHRYGDFRVEVFYFDSPCSLRLQLTCTITCSLTSSFKMTTSKYEALKRLIIRNDNLVNSTCFDVSKNVLKNRQVSTLVQFKNFVHFLHLFIAQLNKIQT